MFNVLVNVIKMTSILKIFKNKKQKKMNYNCATNNQDLVYRDVVKH